MFQGPIQPNQHIHLLGISDVVEEKVYNGATIKLSTMEQIKNMLGHNDRDIQIIKMDVEGSEWKVGYNFSKNLR